MALALVELLILIALLAIPILMLVALIDLLGHPASSWDATDQDRLVWLLVVVFVTIVGPVLYLAMARPRLRTARAPHVATGGPAHVHH